MNQLQNDILYYRNKIKFLFINSIYMKQVIQRKFSICAIGLNVSKNECEKKI